MKRPPLRPLRLRIDIDALVRLPGAGEPAERPEIGETVGRDVLGLGEDVGRNGEHGDLASLRGAAIAQGSHEFEWNGTGREPARYEPLSMESVGGGGLVLSEKAARQSIDAGFLAHGGELGAAMRALDWSDSPAWPSPPVRAKALKTTVSMLLAAQAQIVLFWGPEFVALYNDAYAPGIGTKHPRALGRPAIENWGELWDDLEPLLAGVRQTRKTFAAKDRPFYIERHGYGETSHWDVSIRPCRTMMARSAACSASCPTPPNACSA